MDVLKSKRYIHVWIVLPGDGRAIVSKIYAIEETDV